VSQAYHGENDSTCEKRLVFPANSVMMNFHAKETNSITKTTNSTTNLGEFVYTTKKPG